MRHGLPNRRRVRSLLLLPSAQTGNQFFQHGADGFRHQDLRGEGKAGGIFAVAFGFFLQYVEVLDALECEVLSEDKGDLFAPNQTELSYGFTVFDVLNYLISG